MAVPERYKFTRRDFLKGIGFAAAGATAGLFLHKYFPDLLVHEVPVQKEIWENNRFFEDIETFSISLLSGIQRGLHNFGEHFGQDIDREQGFDQKKWNESGDKSLHHVYRIKNLFDFLKQTGELDDVGENLLKRDYYFATSPIWAVLRVSEKFWNDREGFRDALQHPGYSMETGNVDPFLKEIVSINAPWASVASRIIEGDLGKSNVSQMLNAETFYKFVQHPPDKSIEFPSDNHWYKVKKNHVVEHRQVLILPSEPSTAKNEIANTLQQFGLDRTANTIEIKMVDGTKAFIGITNDPDHAVINIPREFKNSFTIDALIRALVLELEAKRILDLTAFLPDDRLVFLNRVRIEKIITMYSPYFSKKYFRGAGAFNSIFSNNQSTLESLREAEVMAEKIKIFNYTSMTDSPMIYDERETEATTLLRIATILTPSDGLKRQFLVNRIAKHYNLNSENYPTFKEFWLDLMKKFQNEGGQFYNSFEELITTKITENLDIFDAKDRIIYYRNKDWYYWLINDVIPMVIRDWYNSHRVEFKNALLAINSNEDAQKVLEQAVNIFGLDFTIPRINRDLFAQIFQHTLRRNDHGIDNQIDDDKWKELEGLIYPIIDALKADGLA